MNFAPDLWRIEVHRLEDIVLRHRSTGKPEVWQVFDGQRRLIVEIGSEIRGFQLARSRPILDAGERVGELRIARSRTPVVTWTAGVAVVAALLGVGIYVILRVLPIRALEFSEGRFLAVMDSAPDAILVLDPVGRITLSNASTAVLFGLTSPEMVGPHLSQLVKDSDRPRLESAIENILHSGGSTAEAAETMELTGLARERAAFPVEARFSVWRTETETSIVCVLRDVTDRKRTEAALDESREQSVTLLAVSRQISGMLDVTEMMRRVARETGLALGADMVGVFLTDAEQIMLCPIAGYHVPKDLLGDFMATPIPLKGHRILEEAWEERRAVAVSDVPGDPRVDQAFLRRFPHHSPEAVHPARAGPRRARRSQRDTSRIPAAIA